MLDYRKTEDMERMKAEAVKRLKWPKIPITKEESRHFGCSFSCFLGNHTLY